MPKYSGYAVFNKPKYRPRDTVRFKFFLVRNDKRKSENKLLRAEIYDYKSSKEIIKTIAPYTAGGYESSFVLSDSLKLKLNTVYSVVLKELEGNEWKEVIRGSFRYEDYELHKINLNVRHPEWVEYPGRPIALYIRASDENDLTIPDARLEVVVTPRTASNFKQQQTFVKDTLWKTLIKLDPVGETSFSVPDSVFPQANVEFTVQLKALTSDNDYKFENIYLSYKVKDELLRAIFNKGQLDFTYLLDGKNASKSASIYIRNESYELKFYKKVILPYKMKVPLSWKSILVKTDEGFEQDFSAGYFNVRLTPSVTQTKDSLRVTVSNPSGLRFWYSLFSGNKVFKKGYTTNLDTVMKHADSKAVQLAINYIWAGSANYNQANTFFAEKQLTVELNSPPIVYPGQAVHMEVTVRDVNNNCENTATNVIVAGTYADPRFLLNKTDVSCLGNDGTIDVYDVQYGLAPFDYTIIAPSPSNVGVNNITGHFTNLTPGEYAI
ncbi:MAG: hypothetical protein EOO20_24175, partial [Chryseobacterium sp.]